MGNSKITKPDSEERTRRKEYPMPSADEVKDALRRALTKFYSKDIYLIHNNAHERSLTFRLGMYLQEEFPSWNVDCEYNRYVGTPGDNDLPSAQYDPKRNGDGRRVVPDIIIHHRGTTQNLLVIEAKKKANEQEARDDIRKVQDYMQKDAQGYRYGLFLNFQDTYAETEKCLSDSWFPCQEA